MKARVKHTHNYGGHGAGSIIDVEPSEIERAHWCLEAVEEEAPPPPPPAPSLKDEDATPVPGDVPTAQKKGKK